jgi:hypothetical protein|tara:strand:- start:2742 stop:2942 length:201 start_codon:yes stop_codon:yes gene_type:complete
MAKKKTGFGGSSSPEVGDVVIYEYRDRTFPAIVESIDDEGRPNLTGFENGTTVSVPGCKDEAWHTR